MKRELYVSNWIASISDVLKEAGMQDIENVIAGAGREFAQLLQKRLERKIPTTEDSVRYTFFAALLRADVEPEQVILEKPYSDQGKPEEELDMLIRSPEQMPLAAIEIQVRSAR